MRRIMALTSFAFLSLLLASNGWPANPAAPEAPEEEAKERLERLAPPGGIREGALANQPVPVMVNGVKKTQFTGADLDKLPSTAAFTPRGGKKSWTVLEVLKAQGVTSGKTVNFYDKKDKKISLPWEDLQREKSKVTFSYNFKGELIVSTDIADRVPEDVRSTDPRDAGTEDKRREEMHKQRQRSLIFFRNVRRVEVIQ